MRLRPTLVVALIVLAACSNTSPQTSVTSSAPTPKIAGSPPAADDTTVDDGTQQCVHTDPGRTPISVHRALGCPDGTEVTVAGVVVRNADGSELLCDAADCADGALTIDEALSPSQVVPASTGSVVYVGTISGGVLTPSPRSNISLVAATGTPFG